MRSAPAYVVDASVALKWYLPEEGSDRAEALLQAATQGVVSLSAPDLLLLEVGNACWKRIRHQELTANEALSILSRLKKAPLRWVPDGDLALAALDLAATLGCTVYDASYLVLSQSLGGPLITDDRKLCAICATAGLADQTVVLSALEL